MCALPCVRVCVDVGAREQRWIAVLCCAFSSTLRCACVCEEEEACGCCLPAAGVLEACVCGSQALWTLQGAPHIAASQHCRWLRAVLAVWAVCEFGGLPVVSLISVCRQSVGVCGPAWLAWFVTCLVGIGGAACGTHIHTQALLLTRM